ncbi:MAG: hypothetical protein FJ276_34595 [Planctomycetes bacterium]|nr:hypothetical protein [Planctomycetota bacterium]
MSTTPPRLSDQELSDLVRRAIETPPGHLLWGAVGQQILEIVRDKAPTMGFDSRTRQELESDGVSFLFEQVRAGKWNPAGGHFRGWSWRVLKNLGRQIVRDNRHRRATTLPATSNALQESADCPPAIFQPDDPIGDIPFADAVRDYRRMLDDIAATAEFICRVDYFAVFLLELRRTAIARAVKSLKDNWDLDCNLAAFVEQCFPWHAHEAALQIKPDFPTLMAIWMLLDRHVRDTRESPTAAEFCAIVSRQLATSGKYLSVAAWIKWSQRSRGIAREAMDSQQWDRWFAHWWSRRSS